MVSTDKAVNPTNVMGCSKRLAEIYVQSLGCAIREGKIKGHTKFITTRFGNVLGSNGSVIPRFRDQLAKGGPLTVTHPDIIRYFMTIPEACRLVLEAAFMGKGNEIFVFDMGTPVKIADLARRMIELAGLIPEKDIEIKYTGLRPGEKLYEELLATKENTLPTNNAKIFRAKVRKYDFMDISILITRLVDLSIRVEKLEAVKEARAQGDLSENFEYYAAKKDKNANEKRIRYLDRMVRTAEIIKDESADDEVGLNNTVRVYFEEDEEEDTYRIVTTVREDVLNGIISNISPMGKALLGHKVGDRVEVVPGKGDPFHIVIREIVKTTDESRDHIR